MVRHVVPIVITVFLFNERVAMAHAEDGLQNLN
jgi:hypothetical protein